MAHIFVKALDDPKYSSVVKHPACCPIFGKQRADPKKSRDGSGKHRKLLLQRSMF